MGADQVAALNAAFIKPGPDVDERTGRHTGFPVVHRIRSTRSASGSPRAAAEQRHGRDGDVAAAPAL
jgi:hypothetical protein